MSTPALLQDVKVVDFSQFLAGPYCSLQLLDLGATVIKVENPDGGDLTRRIYLSGTKIDEDSTLFHAINRGKQSVALNLKNDDGRTQALDLVKDADIVIQNFRPGVIERLGLDYQSVRRVNPDIVYGSITGYGTEGPWAHIPGQDLLVQARSGVMWLSGNRDAGPVPIGIPVADMMAGAHLAHGLLAALYRRERHRVGTHVETSLLEAMIDLQFEYLTTYLNNDRTPPERLVSGSAHGYLAAPYGLFETADGHLAIAMNDLEVISIALDLPALGDLLARSDSDAAFLCRDEIQAILSQRLKSEHCAPIEQHLTNEGIWCAKVLTWQDLLNSKTFQALDMLQSPAGSNSTLLRSPLRIDGTRAPSETLAPRRPT